MSLELSYTRTLILIRALYTQLQAICPFVVFNKSSVTATFRALKATNKTIITCLVIRSGGISLNRLLRPFKRRLASIIPLRQK
jgi:hypothetical protein